MTVAQLLPDGAFQASTTCRSPAVAVNDDGLHTGFGGVTVATRPSP